MLITVEPAKNNFFNIKPVVFNVSGRLLKISGWLVNWDMLKCIISALDTSNH